MRVGQNREMVRFLEDSGLGGREFNANAKKAQIFQFLFKVQLKRCRAKMTRGIHNMENPSEVINSYYTVHLY